MDKAALLLEQAVQTAPRDVDLHLKLARFLMQRGDLDAAADQLRTAARQNPDDIEVYIELARLELDRGNADVADRVLSLAFDVDPRHVEVLLLKAELAERRGRLQSAMETYYRVLSQKPQNVRASRRLANLQLASGRPDLAASLLRSLCRRDDVTVEQRAEARWTLGEAYGRQRRWDEAVGALASSVPFRRDMTADDWYRLAYARYRAGDMAGARSGLEAAIRLQPDHASALAMAELVEPRRSTSGSHSGSDRTAMVHPPAGW